MGEQRNRLYADSETVATYENAETIPRVAPESPLEDAGLLVAQFRDSLSNLKLTQKEQLQVIEAVSEINEEEGRERPPKTVKEQYALLQRAAKRALGHEVGERFTRSATKEGHVQKRQVDRFLEQMALMQGTVHGPDAASKALGIVKKGEYWSKSPADLRDEFEKVMHILDESDRLAA